MIEMYLATENTEQGDTGGVTDWRLVIQHSLHTTEVLLVSAGVELSGGSDRSDPVDIELFSE